MRDTGDLAENLMEELNCQTAFTIPIFGGIEVAESVVIMWGIMAVFVVLCLILVRNFSVTNPGKKQMLLEICISKLYGFFYDILGEKGKPYIYYLMSVAIFIGASDIIGIFGFKPPTKDLNVTIAFAVLSIILIEAAGIRAKGPKKWLKSFAQPVAIVAPMNVLELFIRPFSLCLRLFGNVLGACVIMKLIKMAVPIGAPVALSLYFDIFDGLIQAYVFVFLTSLYMKEALE